MESIEAAIGRTFQNTREAQGISIYEAAEDTKINAQTLREMEEGDFSGIPAPVYARGFIRTYADYLGLDAAEMVRKYASHRREAVPFSVPGRRGRPAGGDSPDGSAGRVVRRGLSQLIGHVKTASGAKLDSSSMKKADPSPQRADRVPRKQAPSTGVPSWVWLSGTAIMVLVVFSLTVMAIATLPKKAPEVAAKHYSNEELGQHAERAAVVQVSPKINPFHRPSPESPHRVGLELMGRTWLSVRVEGTIVEEGFFDSGYLREWSGHRVQVRIGRPENVLVRVDGKICDMGEDRLPVVMTVTSGTGNRQDTTRIE